MLTSYSKEGFFHDHGIQQQLDPKPGDRLTRHEMCPFHGSRILASSKPGDIVRLPKELHRHLPWINDHYAKAGLKCSQDVTDEVFDPDSGLKLDGYIFTRQMHRFNPDTRWLKAVDKYNSKNNFIRICRQLNLKVPQTFCYESKRDLHEIPLEFPFFFKIDVAISGNGVVKCESEMDLKKCLNLIDESISFQLQKSIGDDAVFLNLQYWTENGNLHRYLVTEQELDGFVHVGNAYPARWNPWKETESIASLMVAEGIKRYFAFDLGVVPNGGNPQFYLIECNPRYNGSTYATRIIEKLGLMGKACYWISKSVKTKKSKFDFDLGEVGFDGSEGAIVYNFGIQEGSVGVLIVGKTKERRRAIERKFEKLL